MKILLAMVLSLSTFTVFCSEPNLKATEKFTSFLPVGYYGGHDDHGRSCKVMVTEVNYPKKDIQVQVSVGKHDLAKLIEEGSMFSYRDYKKEFIQTERSVIGANQTDYVERIVRTVAVSEKKSYVVVSYSIISGSNRSDEIAECVVNL